MHTVGWRTLVVTLQSTGDRTIPGDLTAHLNDIWRLAINLLTPNNCIQTMGRHILFISRQNRRNQ
jgi:hypothetical protein